MTDRPWSLGWWGGGTSHQGPCGEYYDNPGSWEFERRVDPPGGRAKGSRMLSVKPLLVKCKVEFSAKTLSTFRDGWNETHRVVGPKRWSARVYVEGVAVLERASGKTYSMIETMRELNFALDDPNFMKRAFQAFSKHRIEVEREGEPFLTMLGDSFSPDRVKLPPGEYTYKANLPGRQIWWGARVDYWGFSAFPLGDLDTKNLEELEQELDALVS